MYRLLAVLKKISIIIESLGDPVSRQLIRTVIFVDALRSLTVHEQFYNHTGPNFNSSYPLLLFLHAHRIT